MYKIYGLVNPVDNKLFYVGSTKYSLRQRLNSHLGCVKDIFSNKRRVVSCIKDILSVGLTPEIFEIDSCSTKNETRDLEELYILLFRYYGFDLTNMVMPCHRAK